MHSITTRRDDELNFVHFTRYVSVDDENGVELFYYFIKSEGDPHRDPVLLWLTGGDHCSVLSGMAFEIGEQLDLLSYHRNFSISVVLAEPLH